MFDIGLQELVVIFVLALLVFGPKNLPQLGRSLGRAMREFRRASEEFRSTIETNLEINAPDPVISPSLDTAAPVESPPTPGVAASPELVESVVEVAGAGTAGSEEQPAEPFFAQRAGRLVHSRDCGWAKRVAEPERLWFKRLADAREAGFLVCPSCDPWEPG